MNQPVKRLETAEAAKGLVCRACGCRHFEMMHTRRALGNRVMRRRACRHCGRRMMTYELPAGEN